MLLDSQNDRLWNVAAEREREELYSNALSCQKSLISIRDQSRNWQRVQQRGCGELAAEYLRRVGAENISEVFAVW